MFPINANDPYIKKTGERSTVAAALEGGGGGGGSELPEYSEADAGKVLTVDSNGDLEFDTVLPAYSSSDEGKVLGVTADGTLAWGTVSGGFNNAVTEITHNEMPTVNSKEVTE